MSMVVLWARNEKKMMVGRVVCLFLVLLMGVIGMNGNPTRILLDTDLDTDDVFALFYLLKQNRSEFDLKAVTINANAWSDAGHAVNHVYDILYMMDRDDIPVGVGGDGGISDDGTIYPDVGGFLPLIEQGMSTAGYCRYRQAVPIQNGGRLKVDTNFGLRRGFLPQGDRKYSPLQQPTAQQVMIDTISAGPTTVFLIGAHTNLALFLMTNPHLKKNIEHIYVMGGGVRSKNPTGCCPRNASISCKPQQCGDRGNLFTAYTSNPYAEFNIFGDPFAAYQLINLQEQSGRFNFTTQFPYYNEILYTPDYTNMTMGKPVIFDMDMSAGDFLSLIYLLKVPVEVMDLKGILVSASGWANAATVDIIYDVLHMMGRDDIPVGLGNQSATSTPSLSCEHAKAIPHGSGGFIDSDTLFGLARTLPRSPRRYTSETFGKYGPPRDTDNPGLRQPSALEVWQSVSSTVAPSERLTILTNGPLTNLADIILSDENPSSVIQEVYVVGGHIVDAQGTEGNIFTVPSNKYAEFNMFLDPLAAKTVLESDIDINLIPLSAQRQVTSFPKILQSLQLTNKTPESIFTHKLLSLLHKLQQSHPLYNHMGTFLGEILGAVFMVDQFNLSPIMHVKPIIVSVGNISVDGEIVIDERNGKPVNILDSLDSEAYYSHFANSLARKTQSATISSFDEQKRRWERS